MSHGSVPRAAKGEIGYNSVNAYIHQDQLRTCVSELFTSNKNVNYLMQSLKQAVLEATGIEIGPQSIQALASYMKGVHDAYAPYSYNDPQGTVDMLNAQVLQNAIHSTVQSVLSYKRYLRDSQGGIAPPDRPVATSVAGDRTFEINRFI